MLSVDFMKVFAICFMSLFICSNQTLNFFRGNWDVYSFRWTDLDIKCSAFIYQF